VGHVRGKRDQLGPGSRRVGRWVGRLGVVSLPAVEVALSLDARVVRRHVARLEQAGWLHRAAGMRGEGSVVWLTERGLGAVGLGGLTAVRASPAPSAGVAAHAVLVAWSAARAERRGRVWLSARELALELGRWEVQVRGERGWHGLLPDLAVWSGPDAPVPFALMIDSGFKRSGRQRAILEAWRAAIHSGQYWGVRYDCTSEQAARKITNLGQKVGLPGAAFLAAKQTSPAEIAAIEPKQGQDQAIAAARPPAIDSQEHSEADCEPEQTPDDGKTESFDHEPERKEPPPATRSLPESPEAAAERERSYREIFGIPEPKPKRRLWRR
jgi:hypothetical protein